MSDLEEEVSALRRRLESFDKDALIEMCVQLSRTYVLEGLGALSSASGPTTPAVDDAGQETFAGMLRRLKRDLPDDPVLTRFIINGEHIQVKTPGGNVDVTEYRRPSPPPRPSVAAPAVPAPSDSVYNRPLHEAPAASARPAAAPPRPPSTPAPAATQEKAPPQDRMSLIELD